VRGHPGRVEIGEEEGDAAVRARLHDGDGPVGQARRIALGRRRPLELADEGRDDLAVGHEGDAGGRGLDAQSLHEGHHPLADLTQGLARRGRGVASGSKLLGAIVPAQRLSGSIFAQLQRP
jgi:hypothetical protein